MPAIVLPANANNFDFGSDLESDDDEENNQENPLSNRFNETRREFASPPTSVSNSGNSKKNKAGESVAELKAVSNQIT